MFYGKDGIAWWKGISRGTRKRHSETYFLIHSSIVNGSGVTCFLYDTPVILSSWKSQERETTYRHILLLKSYPSSSLLQWLVYTQSVVVVAGR